MTSAFKTSAFPVLLAFGTLACVGCGDDAGNGGVAGTDADAGSVCGPGETESPNGVCIENVPCGVDIPTFKIGLQADGRDGIYAAKIVDASPSPPKQFRNDWVLDFVDADGKPATDITFDPDKVRTYMPAHGHPGYLPVKIEPLEEPGRFSMKDLNMWMPGPWEAQFPVSGPAGNDYVVFDVCITSLR